MASDLKLSELRASFLGGGNKRPFFWAVASCVVVGEVALMLGYVLRRGYTEIDWRTYMEQVALVQNGERRYDRLRGAQGPLVYPAGFVWLYGGLSRLTDGGNDIRLAQYVFAFLFVFDTIVMAVLYALAEVPALALPLVALSRRAHSVFALRLFNDGPCATVAHVAIILLAVDRTFAACVAYSLAVSIKMSALLYAPAWYVVLVAKEGHLGALQGVALCALVQFLVALPFLRADPVAYVSAAFNFGRGFKHKWSVNFKWVPCSTVVETDLADCEGVFSSKAFQASLLLGHGLALVAFAKWRWRRDFLGIFFPFFGSPPISYSRKAVVVMLFSCNFVGLAFARSLHFQFCVWYVKSLPILAFATKLPRFLKLALLVAIELAWNPWGSSETSTVASSLLLTVAHLVLLVALFVAPDADFFFHDEKTTPNKLEEDHTTKKKKMT